MLVHGHDAEAAGLGPGDLHHGNGAGGPGILVMLEHPGIVHLIDVVAGQHRHILRVVQVHKADVLINGVGGCPWYQEAPEALWYRGRNMTPPLSRSSSRAGRA